MASRINTHFILILFIVGSSLVAVVGGLWFIKSRSDVTRALERAEEFMAQGDYRRARSSYASAVGKDPANLEYVAKLEQALLQIQPDTGDEAMEFFRDYINVLRHAAVHHPTDPSKHLRLLRELDSTARRAGLWGSDTMAASYTEVLLDAAEDMSKQVPASRSERRQAQLYMGIARVSPWMQDRLPEEEYEQGIGDLEAFLAEVPDSDRGWASLVDARLRLMQRLRQGGQVTRADEQNELLHRAMADGRAAAEGPELLLASLAVVGEDRRENPELVDDASTRVDLDRVVEMARESDDQWLVWATATALQRTYWLPDRTDAVAFLDEYVAAHPEAYDLMTLKSQIQFLTDDLDGCAATANVIIEGAPLGVSFTSLYQTELKRLARSRLVDVVVRRWDVAPDEEQPALLDDMRAARDELAAVTRDQENDPLLLKADAQIAFADRNYARAAALFNRLMSMRAGDYQTKLLAALSLERLGEIGAAVELIDEALEDNPTNIPLLMHQVNLRGRMGQYEEASDLIEQVLTIDPEHERALQLEESLAGQLDQSSTVATDSIRTVMNAAAEAYQAGDYDAARAALLTALEQMPDNLNLLSGLVQLEFAAGQTEQARRYVERGLSISPRSRKFLTYRAHLDNPDRIEAVKQYIDDLHDDPTRKAVETLMSLRAIRLQYRGQAGQAEASGDAEAAASARDLERRAFEEEDVFRAKVQQLAPEDARYIEYRFLRAVGDRDFDELQRVVDDATRLNSDQASGAMYAGRLALARGEEEDAVRRFREALDLTPYSATAWRLLAIAYQQLGNAGEALTAFEHAWSNNPSDISVVKEYARLLNTTGNTTRGLIVVRNGRRLAPEDAALRELWLVLETESGDAAVALTERRRLYAAEPGDLRNAAALATFLASTDPIRELMIDEDGNEEYSLEKWGRLPARGQRSQGAILANRKRQWLDEADSIVDGMVAPEERDINWYRLRAEVLRFRGEMDMGVQELRAFADAQDPGERRLQALISLGMYLAESERTDEAVAAFSEALEHQNPDEVVAHAALAELLFRVGRDAEARPHFEAAVAGSDSRLMRLMFVESLVRMGEHDDARARLDALEVNGVDGKSVMLRASVAMKQAQEHWDADRDDEAELRFEEHRRLLERGATLDPWDPLPHVLQAEAMLEKFRRTDDVLLLDDALLMLDRGEEVRAGYARASLVRVEVLDAKGDRRGAISELTRFVETAPSQDAPRGTLLRMLLADGRNDAARRVAEEAVRLKPGSTTWRVTLGDLYFQKMMETQAKLARRDPASRDAAAMQDEVNRLRKMIDDQYRAALANNPSPGLVLRRVEVQMSADPPGYHDAVAIAEQYPEALEASPMLRSSYGKALAGTGRRQDALDQMRRSYAHFRQQIAAGERPAASISVWYQNLKFVFEDGGAGPASTFAMEQCGGNPDSYDLLALATSWRILGREGLSRAFELLQSAADTCPTDDPDHKVSVYSELALVLLSLDRNEEALRAFQVVLEIQADNAEVLNNVAYLLADTMNDPVQALPYAERAAELVVNSSAILDTLGWIHFRLGNYEDAERILRESTEIQKTPTNQLHLANVFLHQGNTMLANRHLAAAAELKPDRETLAEINRLRDDIARGRTGGGR